jgi:hypothetical protein
MAVDTTFPPDSAEARYLSQAINNEIQALAQGPATAEVSAEKIRLQAAMDSQEQAAADYVKNASPSTPPPSPKGFFRKLFSKGDRS